MSEFLGMVDYFFVKLVPNEIFRSLGLSTPHVVLKLVGTLCALVVIGAFTYISLGAFAVDVESSKAKEASGAGASLLRAGFALFAALGLRQDASDLDENRYI